MAARTFSRCSAFPSLWWRPAWLSPEHPVQLAPPRTPLSRDPADLQCHTDCPGARATMPAPAGLALPRARLPSTSQILPSLAVRSAPSSLQRLIRTRHVAGQDTSSTLSRTTPRLLSDSFPQSGVRLRSERQSLPHRS